MSMFMLELSGIHSLRMVVVELTEEAEELLDVTSSVSVDNTLF